MVLKLIRYMHIYDCCIFMVNRTFYSFYNLMKIMRQKTSGNR